MIVFNPGIMETVLRALNTRNVLKPAKFPTSEMREINVNFAFFCLKDLLLITHAKCCVTTCDDDKIEPIPRISQISIFVDGKALGNDLDKHFDGINRQEEEFSLFKRLALRKKNAIEKNRCHNEIIEKLIRRNVHADPS